MSTTLNPLKKIPRTVIVLGFVSFFNDLASDMVIPLIGLLLFLMQKVPVAPPILGSEVQWNGKPG